MTRRRAPRDTLAVHRETIDPLTGEPVPRNAPEALDTGRKVATVRTPKGGALRLHLADDDARYLVLRRRAAAPVLRSTPPPRLGATFRSPDAAVREFVARNGWFFDSEAFDGGDYHDPIREWLDGIDSAHGRKHVRAVDARVGKRILAERQGAPMVRAALRYAFGRARGRRWRNVAWRDVDALLEAIQAQLEADVERTGVPAPAGQWNYPLGSGLLERDALYDQAVDELGPRRARALLRWLTAQDLHDLVERGRAALAAGAGCLEPAAARAARRRLGVMRRWAMRPELMPDWACAASDRAGVSGLCTVPALAADVLALEQACEVPYDPARPVRDHASACARGDAWGTGLAPCAADHPPDNEIDHGDPGPLEPFEALAPDNEIPW